MRRAGPPSRGTARLFSGPPLSSIWILLVERYSSLAPASTKAEAGSPPKVCGVSGLPCIRFVVQQHLKIRFTQQFRKIASNWLIGRKFFLGGCRHSIGKDTVCVFCSLSNEAVKMAILKHRKAANSRSFLDFAG